MENNVVHGFKVFRPDWTCSPNDNTKQYACPGKFEEEGELDVCCYGMHFCENAADCFNYYDFDSNNRVAEVIAYGTVLKEGNKSCTDKLEIVREIPWDEVLRIVNMGKNCTGLCNSGDWNSGDRNSGDWNSGDRNSGNRNSGNRNSGNRNSGDRNSGDWNSGNRNSGDWNKTNFSNGCFNTIEPKIHLFNKPSEWTYRDWLHSEACYLLNHIPGDMLKYIWLNDMTDEEKAVHPETETTGGYLKVLDESDCGQLWWDGLSDLQKNIIKALPNFDPEIFEQCTGININAKYEN